MHIQNAQSVIRPELFQPEMKDNSSLQSAVTVIWQNRTARVKHTCLTVDFISLLLN